MASFLGVQAKGLFTNATANKLDTMQIDYTPKFSTFSICKMPHQLLRKKSP